MMNFIKLLFFYKSILLTQNYLYLGENEIFTIELDERPISAITQGANFEIDVSRIFQNREDIRQLRKEIKESLSGKKIEITIKNKNKSISFTYNGGISINHEKTYIILSSLEKIPIEEHFTNVTVRSEYPLNGVLISWKNAKK